MTEPTPEEIEDFKLQELESRQRAYTNEAIDMIDEWAKDFENTWQPEMTEKLVLDELIDHCSKTFKGEGNAVRNVLSADIGLRYVIKLWIAGEIRKDDSQ